MKHKQSIELTPIEVAIDEMQNRVVELEEVVLPPIDVKKLQLRLQGSVAVQVNAGPLAYALAFLDPKEAIKFNTEKVEHLKDVFRLGAIDIHEILKNNHFHLFYFVVVFNPFPGNL